LVDNFFLDVFDLLLECLKEVGNLAAYLLLKNVGLQVADVL
jgi:hypothetical protein